MIREQKARMRKIFLKSLCLHAIFLVLHYTYDFFPGLLSSIFSGINESVFQHMKIAFFSIMLASGIEILREKGNPNLHNRVYIHLLSAVFYPWFIFLFFYIPPVLFGKYTSMLTEIVSANIILLISSLTAITFETEFSHFKTTRVFKILSIILFSISGFLYTYYTFNTPWFDVFAVPPGW